MSIEALQLIKVRAHLEPAFRVQLMSNPLHFLQQYDLTEDENANNAIIRIREWRPGSIETSEQEAVVYEYERFISTRV